MVSRKFGHEGSLPLFPTASVWKAPSINDLPAWSRANCASLDTEFIDKTLRELGCGARRGAEITGISFMLEGDRPYYCPVRHPDGNMENPDKVFQYFHDQFKNYRGRVLGANVTGDLDVLHYEKGGGVDGIRFDYSKVQIVDVQVTEPLIWELEHSYSLANIAARRKVPGKDKALLKKAAQDYGYDVEKSGWEAAIPKLPAKFVGEYAEQDAAALFPIFASQWKDIQEQNLEDIFLMSCKVLPLLLMMRQRGVALDFKQLEKVEHMAAEDERSLVSDVLTMTGIDIGFNGCMAASRVAPALEALGIDVPLTESGMPSITTDVLAHIDHPVAKKIRELRQANKIRTTFCQSLKRYQTNGRLHTTFRQIVGANDKNESSGAAFGRLSSANPNIQQQPSRGKYAKPWRKIFVPDNGYQWLSADYSAVEPRWLCHMSLLLNLPGAKQLGDEYCNNPRIDPHGAMARIVYGDGFTEDDRKRSKTMVLGTMYGMGGAKLCRMHLNLPTRWLVEANREKHYFSTRAEALTFRIKQKGKWSIREVAGEEGQAVQDQFHGGAPFIKLFARKVIEKVEATGTLRLLGGRVIHFPVNADGSYDWAFKGPNRVIQGSAGIHLQMALLAIEAAFPGFLQMSIHDEVCGSCPDLKTAKSIGEIMENVVKCLIPFRSELEWGPNWGEQKVVCNVPKCTNMADPIDKFGCYLHKKVA